MTQMARSSPANSQWRRRRKSPAMALLHSIIASQTAAKKPTDDFRIRIPLHIIQSLPLANKMDKTKKTKKTKTKKETTDVVATGRKAGQGNYFLPERMHLLRIIYRVLPIGPEEWQLCTGEHALQYPGRCQESIRRKYNGLSRRKIPTGDPNCPEDVKLAKRIRWAIGNRASVGDAEEEFSLDDTSFTPVKPDPDAPVVAPPVIAASVSVPSVGDKDTDDSSDDEPEIVPRPKKRAYKRKDSKEDFLQLMQMNMLRQQEERAEDRKERAAERQQMMAMMMAMMSGKLPPPTVPPPAVAPPPRLEEEEESDSDDSDDLEAAFKMQHQALEELLPKKRTPVATPVAVGVTTRFHKKKRGLGNSSNSSNVEVSDFI